MANNCTPRPMAPTRNQMADPCYRADALRGALHDILINGRTQILRDGERWRHWSAPDLPTLRAELKEAERLCAAASGGGRRMFRAGPYGRSGL